MAEIVTNYLIVGAGLAGAWAVQGIREYDREGSILLVGSEKDLPYDRPPLTKQLWTGKKTLDEIFVQGRQFYDENGVSLVQETTIVSIDVKAKRATSDRGTVYRYEKLLLATGGTPRRLAIPGGDLDGVCYYRYLDDYVKIRERSGEGRTALVVGGGFIGSEIAAALTMNGVKTTMVFPASYLVDRVFPRGLGFALQHYYMDHKGVHILSGDRPARIERKGNGFLTETERGRKIESDILIVGVGITPSVDLAKGAGLKTDNGIVVDECLATSHPDVYAAGDNALFPYAALGRMMRIEHWDNAVNQGKWAGWNMAGAQKPYTYMPYFFSDLFEFGYEAVGEVDSHLETFADWEKENHQGVLYYLTDGKVRGTMMCNVWGKVDAARDLIRQGRSVTPERLRGMIREAA